MSAMILLCAAALATAGSSSAQFVGRIPPEPRVLPSFNPATGRDLRDVRSDIRAGRERGELSRRDARRLRREANEISMLEERYSNGGLSDAERAELRSRIEVLRAITRGKRLGTLR